MIIKRAKPRKGPNIPAAPPTDFDKNRHYRELVCGHITDLDSDAMYRTQESPRDKLWCDNCGSWKKEKPKPKAAELPEEPLF